MRGPLTKRLRPATGLAAVDDLRSSGWTATAAACATARSLTANPVEQALLDTQRATLSLPSPEGLPDGRVEAMGCYEVV